MIKKFYTSILSLCFTIASIFAVKSEMVLVEGGTFQMGDDIADAPTRTVSLESFYMDKYKVTLYDWYSIMGSNPSNYNTWGILNSMPKEHSERKEYSAMGISWYEALIYCNRKSIQEGLEPCYSSDGSKDAITNFKWAIKESNNGYKINRVFFSNVECDWNANGYRLPTEAEWEYAARGGKYKSPYIFSGSDDFREVINMTAPYKLAKKKSNALGIHDMSMGPEWCWDYYSSSYYNSGDDYNPHGPTVGDIREVSMSIIVDGRDKIFAPCRVLRGGEYEYVADVQNETAAQLSSVYSRSFNHPENYDRPGVDAPLFMIRVVRKAEKSKAKIYRNVEVMIFGKPYYYFMTDKIEELCKEYPDFISGKEKLIKNPNLSPAVISRMEELGCCYSVTFSNGSAILNFYDAETGPSYAFLKKLNLSKENETAKSSKLKSNWFNHPALKDWRIYMNSLHDDIYKEVITEIESRIKQVQAENRTLNKYDIIIIKDRIVSKHNSDDKLPSRFNLSGKMSNSKFANILNKIIFNKE